MLRALLCGVVGVAAAARVDAETLAVPTHSAALTLWQVNTASAARFDVSQRCGVAVLQHSPSS